MNGDNQKNIFIQALEQEKIEREQAQQPRQSYPINNDAKNDFLKSLQSNQQQPSLQNSAINPNINNNQQNKKMSATALFVTMFMLFLFIISLFIFIMSVGGSGNPILKTFGVPEDGAKAFLLKLVNGSFATFATILLIVFSIALFVAFSTKKEDKLKRRGSFIFSAVCGGLIFPVIIIWLGMYSFVNAFVVEKSALEYQIQIIVPDPDNIIAPLDVEFSAAEIKKAIEKKGYIIEGYSWDFGTGAFQKMIAEDRIIQRFTTTGNYKIRLEITAKNGEKEVFEKNFKIDKAQFGANPSSGNAPLRIEFDAQAVTKDMSPILFEWDFDNNGQYEEESTAPKITHTFEQIGKYPINLRVEDKNGNVKTFKREIEVFGEDTGRLQPKISVSPNVEGTPPFKAQFDASSSSSADSKIISYEWQFNDGSPISYGDKVEHIFTEAGKYAVKLTITDEFNTTKSSEVEIIVQKIASAPKAIVRTIPTAVNDSITGTLPLTVKFNAEDSLDPDNNIIRYEWDFDGDENIDGTGSTAEYTYREIGEYQMKFIVTDADNNQDIKIININIIKQELNPIFIADPETGPVPLTVNFDASNSWCDTADCRIVSYEWDFGDKTKTQLGGAQINHLYTQVGIYDVKLTIYTDQDQKASTTKKIFVREIPIISCFNPSRSTGTAPLTVSFDPSCTQGPIEKWQWDFGDGTIVSGRRPNYTFQSPGNYTIILKVFDDKNNVSESQKEIIVKPE